MSTPDSQSAAALSALDSVNQSFKTTVSAHIDQLRGWVRDWNSTYREARGALQAPVLDDPQALSFIEDLSRVFDDAARDLGGYSDELQTVISALESKPSSEDAAEDAEQ